MDSIYDIMSRASALRRETQADSITPEDVGGIQYDTLAYLAEMERSLDGLGIRKVYATKDAMEVDTAPVGHNGKPLRLGQLVVVYDPATPQAEGMGAVYAWQNPGWVPVGSIGDVLSQLATEVAERKAADEALRRMLAPELRFEDIDAIPASAEAAVAMAKDLRHSRYTVTQSMVSGKATLKVGVLDMFSDNMGHQLTEVLTTHYLVETVDGKTSVAKGHDDNNVYTYVRSYHIQGGNSPTPTGAWGEWGQAYMTYKDMLQYSKGVKERMDALEKTAPTAAQKLVLETLPQDIADGSSFGVVAGEGAVTIEFDNVHNGGGEDGYQPVPQELELPAATAEKAGVMTAADKRALSAASVRREVLEFGGSEAVGEVLPSSTMAAVTVVYDATGNRFVGKVRTQNGFAYYNYWDGAEAWGEFSDGGIVPQAGRLYVDTVADGIYRWDADGGALRPLTGGGGSASVEAITNPEIDEITDGN